MLHGRGAYKNYVRSIVTRRNSVTGRIYKDDPTIMAWDLANEPFAPGDDTGNNLTVLSSSSACACARSWAAILLSSDPLLPHAR
jgi:endo-1,4-beta-mannosidase